MKWEYHIISISDLFNRTRIEEVLDGNGENGWELVSVDCGTAYFKRPAPKVSFEISAHSIEVPDDYEVVEEWGSSRVLKKKDEQTTNQEV